MDKNTFDEIVKSRAHERVEEKYKEFKATVLEAARTLGMDMPSATLKMKDARVSEFYRDARMTTLSVFCFDAKLPKYLWEKEEEKVRKELLDTLDEMTKAIHSLSKDKDDSISPIVSDDFVNDTAEQ
jgi:hypothetical protein